jgi:hypothetical protein
MKHHELAPSSFPAWAQCPAFDSDPAERADATEGTHQHSVLAALLFGNDARLAELSQDAAEAVTWAADYVRALAGGAPVLTEQAVSFTAPDSFAPGGKSEVFSGTADAIIVHPPGNLADLIDYKSGADGDHRPQLAGYALALFSMRTRLKTIRAHVLYGRSRRADTWALTQADAAAVVLPILDARRDPARHVPVACDYCGFCVHRATCPALTSRVEAVARTTTPDEWEALAPAIRDPAAITDPALAAKALTVARYVQTWADAIRKQATELAKGGAALPGWRLQERRGAREVTDIEAAFQRTGIPAADFLTACKVSLPKLADAIAKARSLPKKQAAAEVETMLAGLIEERPPTVALVQSKGPE